MRTAISIVLSGMLVFAPLTPLYAAPALGSVEGTVTVDGRPVRGLSLNLVDVGNGATYAAASDAGGRFRVPLAPGRYVISSGATVGLAPVTAPAVVSVQAGQIATAALALTAVQGATTPAPAKPPATGTVIKHEAVGCMIAGEFPMLDATVEPASSVARVRLYFKSAQSDYFYSDMTQIEGAFRGWTPRPTLEAKTITYYILATTTDFGENRTPEIEALVVKEAKDCPEGKKVAPVGQPPASLTFFSAASGAAGVPAGFAAGTALLSGTTLALGAIILAGAAGAAIAISRSDDSPSPAVATTTTALVTTTTTTSSTSTTVTTTTTTTTLPVVDSPACVRNPERCAPGN